MQKILIFELTNPLMVFFLYISVGTRFVHYSQGINEFKPSKPNIINLYRVGRRTGL